MYSAGQRDLPDTFFIHRFPGFFVVSLFAPHLLKYNLEMKKRRRVITTSLRRTFSKGISQKAYQNDIKAIVFS